MTDPKYTESEPGENSDLGVVLRYLSGEIDDVPETEVLQRCTWLCFLEACNMNERLGEKGSEDIFSNRVIQCYTSCVSEGSAEEELDRACVRVLVLLAEYGHPRYKQIGVFGIEGYGERIDRALRVWQVLGARRIGEFMQSMSKQR